MIFFLVTLGLWLVGFVVFWRLPIPQGKPNPAADPSLSILIPARNEEANLPALLRSIASQSVQPREVIVVNDGSADRTAAVAREFGVTVLESLPLPAAWRGKTWACHQGAALAQAAISFCFWMPIPGLSLGACAKSSMLTLPVEACSLSALITPSSALTNSSPRSSTSQ
ncbi:MAG: glycosyltransferase [Verrucomicrobia bacterium]|nr:glycosyltransferase [Verrucomicrobiota bacterium]